MIKKINVLIVDDSLFFRKILQDNLEKDPKINVIGTASHPDEAMKAIVELKPDVVTMDVEMPKMNGIDFIKTVMPKNPLPFVVVSSLPLSVLDALDAGAVDYVKKPQIKSPADLNAFLQELRTKVKIASTVRLTQKNLPHNLPISFNSISSNSDIVIAIGASTGGTEAILEVIRNLPTTTPVL